VPDWLSLGNLINVILATMALEAIWLTRRHRRLGAPGVPPLLLHLVSGALLLLAMQLALAGTPPPIVAVILGVAGLAHLADLQSTLKR